MIGVAVSQLWPIVPPPVPPVPVVDECDDECDEVTGPGPDDVPPAPAVPLLLPPAAAAADPPMIKNAKKCFDLMTPPELGAGASAHARETRNVHIRYSLRELASSVGARG